MHVNDLLNDNAKYHLAVRVFWLVLGAACAAVGLVFLTILVR